MRYRLRKILIIIASLWIVVGLYQTHKSLPTGVDFTGQAHQVPADSVKLLVDQTYTDLSGQRHSEQTIFAEVIRMIKDARQYILVDMFLYNEFQGRPPEETRALANEITQALIEQKKLYPSIAITVISDPLNTVYGGAVSPQFEQLQTAGIQVVITDLSRLRDSNPVYSAVWRTLFQWFGNNPNGGPLFHPFAADGKPVTIRSWLALLNFKANHRKLIVADTTQEPGHLKMATLVTSANPHNGSSAHSNVAIKVMDKVWQDVVKSEQAVASFSGATIPEVVTPVVDENGDVTVQLVTEKAIKDQLVTFINQTQVGDTIDMAMFYLSERSVIASLLQAADRGVKIRLVLDSNKDAFGHVKIGVPNRPVAHELVTQSEGKIQVRWCDTHGEQCHSKLTIFRIGDQDVVVAGSANVTRRNLNNFNLESNVVVSGPSNVSMFTETHQYFEQIWANTGERVVTTDYATYAEGSWWKTLLYRLQETTGLSSF